MLNVIMFITLELITIWISLNNHRVDHSNYETKYCNDNIKLLLPLCFLWNALELFIIPLNAFRQHPLSDYSWCVNKYIVNSSPFPQLYMVIELFYCEFYSFWLIQLYNHNLKGDIPILYFQSSFVNNALSSINMLPSIEVNNDTI